MALAIVLSTPRLTFAPFVASDLDDLLRLHRDQEVQAFMGGAWDRAAVEARLDAYAAEHALRGYSKWKVCLQDGTFAGRAGLSWWEPTAEVELGFVFRRELWGVGLAVEAARALCDWGFSNLQIDHLIGFTHPENLSAQRVMLRVGMARLADQDFGFGEPSAVFRLDRAP